jgi:hypothetical protein
MPRASWAIINKDRQKAVIKILENKSALFMLDDPLVIMSRNYRLINSALK